MFVVSVVPPDVSVQATAGESTAGQAYTLTCTVEKADGVPLDPTVQWMTADGVALESTGNIMIGAVETSGLTSTLTLTFDTLLTSHGGNYTCEAGFGTDTTTSAATEPVIVQSEYIEQHT